MSGINRKLFKRAKFRTSERQRNSGSERDEHTGALAPIASLRELEGISRELLINTVATDMLNTLTVGLNLCAFLSDKLGI